MAGTLGSSDSGVAEKYGPEFFDALTLTWREIVTIEKTPDQAESVVDAKQEQWRRPLAERDLDELRLWLVARLP